MREPAAPTSEEAHAGAASPEAGPADVASPEVPPASAPRRAGWSILIVSACLACAVPAALRHHVQRRIQSRMVPALARAAGVPVRVGDVEFSLLGTLRLRDVAVGDLLAATTIEASVGPDTLVRGAFAADEIRVERPRLAARVLPGGELDVVGVLTRLDRARARARPPTGSPGPRGAGADQSGGGEPRRLRRILVTGGELVIAVADHGEIRASRVELHPQVGGVRAVSGPLEVSLRAGPWEGRAAFARAGLDVSLPGLRPGRVALDGGRLSIRSGAATPLELVDAVVSRTIGVGGDEARLEARLSGGAPLAAQLRRPAGGAAEVALRCDDLPLDVLAGAVPAWVDPGGARARGRLSARRDPATGDVLAVFEGSVSRLRLSHRLVAAEPVPIDGELHAELAYGRASRRARGLARARSGALAVNLDGELAWDEAGVVQALQVGLEIPTVDCAAAFLAVPRALRARLDGLDLRGTVGGQVQAAFDRERDDVTLVLDLVNGCRAAAEPAAADASTLAAPFVHTFPDGSVRLMGPAGVDFVPLHELPDHVIDAFVAGEDARFFRHGGFDPIEIERSFAADVRARRVERGGSTITQQLVKNLFLSRERTLARKLVEAVLAWRVEDRVGKERILEIYLNLVEMGRGVHGVGPGARRWFGKEPDELSVAEAAFLAALTPGPVAFERRLQAAGGLDAYTRARVDAVLRSMRVNRLLDPEAYRRARRERLAPRLSPA